MHFRVTRGTTLNGKSLNAGDILELNPEEHAKLFRDVAKIVNPAPAKIQQKAKKP